MRWARALIAAYVELIRNTPFLVQLFFIFFGLPSLGMRLDRDAGRDPRHDDQPDRLYDRDRRAPGSTRCRAASARPAWRWASQPLRCSSRSCCRRRCNVYPGAGQPDRHHHARIRRRVADRRADLTHVADFMQSRTFRAFETYFAITLVYLGMSMACAGLLARAGRRLFAGRAR